MPQGTIRIGGARQHNLKNLDIVCPCRAGFVVVGLLIDLSQVCA